MPPPWRWTMSGSGPGADAGRNSRTVTSEEPSSLGTRWVDIAKRPSPVRAPASGGTERRRSPAIGSGASVVTTWSRSARRTASTSGSMGGRTVIGSSLERSLEERRDEPALEDQEHEQCRGEDEQGSGAQQWDVGAPLPLEGAQGSGHRALGGVVDEDDGEQELVPGPQEEQDRQRGQRRHRQRDVDPPEELPQVRPVDPGGLRDVVRDVGEVRPHPEHGERHVQAEERQDDRPPGVQEPEVPHLVVERDDDALERQGQPEQERDEHGPAPRWAKLSQSEPGQRGDEQGDRDHADLDEHARPKKLTHLGGLERVDEVAPVRRVRPGEPCWVGTGLVQRGHEQADERHDRDDHEDDEKDLAEPPLSTRDDHESPSRLSHCNGRTTARTSAIRATARAEACPTSRWKNAR